MLHNPPYTVCQMTDFEKICKQGNLKLVNKYILNCNCDWYDWNCGLEGACQGGHIDLVKLMILKGANRLSMGLYYACLHEHLNVVNFLISEIQSNIDENNNHWNCGFAGACNSGNLELVNLMISKPGKRNWDNGFGIACIKGHINVVHSIISNTAGKTKTEFESETKARGRVFDWNFGLSRAASHGHMDIVRFMVSKGANDWNASLYGACSGGHIDIVQFIIEKIEQDNDEITIETIWNHCLGAAYVGGNVKIAHLIISKLKNISNKIHDFYCWPGDCKIVELLYLGTPLSIFSKILGYQTLQVCVSNVKQSILRSSVMLPDLLNIVSQYIII